MKFSLLKTFAITMFMIAIWQHSIAQTSEQAALITERYDKPLLLRLEREFKLREQLDKQEALDFAKANNIPFIATNIPRKYAALVNKGGFGKLDSLTSEEKKWMAPLPMSYDASLPGYVNMIKMMGIHATENMPKAQASKDATMAHFILTNHTNGSLFLHYNGAYHSDNFDGINWYLKLQKPSLKIGTISTVSQANIKSLLAENLGKADFIICVDIDMTNTY
jgi:uncharacterized iron-regulated protein